VSSRVVRLVGGAATVAALLLAGCSPAEEPEGAEPSTTASSGAGTTGSDPSVEASPSASPAPEVPAATGATMTVSDGRDDVFTVRVPSREWRVSSVAESATLVTAEGRSYLSAAAFATSADTTLEAAAEAAVVVQRDRRSGMERVEDRVVAGEQAYVVEGSDEEGFLYEVGALHEASLVTITFELLVDDAASRETIEAVLASVEWV
jgi:hypothetical protein